MTSPDVPAKPRVRDVRLDFFRGVCLVIIYIAHVIDNPWANWIPARFGFSDATEIFVFCSGMASAIAFGATFERHGFAVGAARVMFRVWQVYWAHIGLALIVIAAMVQADRMLATDGSYVRALVLEALFDSRGPQALVGLLTLQWVPHYLDILPMYLVILVMIPCIVALHRYSPIAAAVAVAAMWLASVMGLVALPGEPWSSYSWFFNPFGWQLVFFTGFALMSGWLPAPPVDTRLIRAAALVLVASMPFAWSPLWTNIAALDHARAALAPLIDKSTFGLFRYVHFLSLAYLAYVLAGDKGRNLVGPVVEVFRRLGQQSLAIFMTGIVLSLIASTGLNVLGRSVWTVALVNLGGIAILFAVARVTSYFKAEPWAKKAGPPPSSVPVAVEMRSGRGAKERQRL